MPGNTSRRTRSQSAIGFWERPQLPTLPDGHTRFMMLTPAAARFGQGADVAMRTDRVASGYCQPRQRC